MVVSILVSILPRVSDLRSFKQCCVTLLYADCQIDPPEEKLEHLHNIIVFDDFQLPGEMNLNIGLHAAIPTGQDAGFSNIYRGPSFN